MPHARGSGRRVTCRWSLFQWGCHTSGFRLHGSRGSSLGVQALVTEVAGARAAYVLIDGNNVAQGVRERLRGVALLHVDEAEIMTTDTHTVNTVSGKNPVGYAVPADEIVPYIEQAVREAVSDLAPARVGAAAAWCKGITVFGSQRVSQLASTVNTMLS